MELHQTLLYYKTSLNLPIPTKSHKKWRESFKNSNKENESGKSRLPRFPRKPEVLVQNEQINDRVKQLEDYLYNLLQIKIYRNHPATVSLLSLSFGLFCIFLPLILDIIF